MEVSVLECLTLVGLLHIAFVQSDTPPVHRGAVCRGFEPKVITNFGTEPCLGLTFLYGETIEIRRVAS